MEFISILDFRALDVGFKIQYCEGMENTVTVSQIIKDAGGADAIARASALTGGRIKKDAVYKWRQTGIPDRHWPVVISLTAYGPTDLYAANCFARTVSPELHLGSEAAQ